MTDGNRRGSRVPGVAALALFGVLAAAVLGSAGGFGPAAGFPADESVVHNIGYALFDIDLGGIAAEGFLAAFLLIALALDIALDSAIYLAKREDGGSIVSALTDGGRDVVDVDTAGGRNTAAGGVDAADGDRNAAASDVDTATGDDTGVDSDTVGGGADVDSDTRGPQ
jgi:NADH-quinone oxidoreductase subunit J